MNGVGISRIAGRAAGPIGLIGAVGGFIADVLAPLGAVAPTVAGISALAAVIFGAMTFLESRNKQRNVWDTAYSGGLFVSVCSVLIFSVWSVIFAAGPERGYLADNIDPIAQVQAQLLNIEEDVAVIRDTTTQTAEDVETIATAQAEGNITTEIMATAQAQGFADIQASFASLQMSQTIVENPTTPQEFYSNARLYQLKGNTAEAIKAYEGYLAFNLEYIDPLQDYADLLKATEGINRTQEIMAAQLAANPGSLVTDFVSASLLDSVDERMSRYEALVSRAPTFGPGYLGLGQSIEAKMAAAGGGFQILTERLLEAYSQLETLETTQDFSRYYIDKNRAIALFDTAMRSYEIRSGTADIVASSEVQIMYNPDSVTFIFVFMESLADLRVAIDDPTTLRTTGTLQSMGTSVANTVLQNQQVPLGDHVLYYEYTDIAGNTSELFEFPFTVQPIVASITPLAIDFATGKGNVQVIAYAYQQPVDALYTFYWGLSEDDVTNTGDLPPANTQFFQVSELEVGEHTLYIRAESATGEVLGPYAYPFEVVQ